MRFLKRIGEFFGLGKDEQEVKDEQNHDPGIDVNHPNRRGFSVPVQVAVERFQVGPILVPCNFGEGGVQGLRWYAKCLRIDEDGDVADEFIDEILPEMPPPSTRTHYQRPLPRFEANHRSKPVRARSSLLSLDGTILSLDGTIQHRVEYEGRLLLV